MEEEAERQGTDLTQCRQALHKFSRADLNLNCLEKCLNSERSDTGGRNLMSEERETRMPLPTWLRGIMNYARIGFKGMIFKANKYIMRLTLALTPVAYKGGLLWECCLRIEVEVWLQVTARGESTINNADELDGVKRGWESLGQ